MKTKKYIKLEELRKKNNYTCLDMANLLGLSKTYYWQLEMAIEIFIITLLKK